MPGWTVMKRAAADGRSAGSFGHGGAYKMLMWVDPSKDQILILLRQHSGAENKVEPAFLKAAAQLRP
jgi:CubicO group peptidase (beta-lactamase class C family)